MKYLEKRAHKTEDTKELTKKNYGIVAVIVLSQKEKVENSFKRPNLAPDTRAYAFVCRYL